MFLTASEKKNFLEKRILVSLCLFIPHIYAGADANMHNTDA